MYDFLFSEVWWMETIIAALITASVTLVGSLIFYNYRLKVIRDRTDDLKDGQKELQNGHKDLSKEHKDLSKENRDLSKENRDLSKEVAVKVDGIRELIVIEQTEQKHRHDSLSGNQKVMVDSINNLQTFAKEMEKLQSENIQLRNENEQLVNRNIQLERLYSHNQDNGWER